MIVMLDCYLVGLATIEVEHKAPKLLGNSIDSYHNLLGFLTHLELSFLIVFVSLLYLYQ
jgi:hypothetical protein